MKEEPDLAQSRSGVCTINLKLKTRSKLHSAEVVSGGSYGTETAVLRTNIGKGETLVIRRIEHLCTYLELLVLFYLEFLGKREIHVADSVTPQVGEVPRSIARNVVARKGKAILVQVGQSGLCRLLPAQSCPELGAGDIRPLVAVGQQTGAIEDRYRLPGLQSEEAVNRPTP